MSSYICARCGCAIHAWQGKLRHATGPRKTCGQQPVLKEREARADADAARAAPKDPDLWSERALRAESENLTKYLLKR